MKRHVSALSSLQLRITGSSIFSPQNYCVYGMYNSIQYNFVEDKSTTTFIE